MTEETLNAAIALLRSKALETYGIMKDIYARSAELGDVDLIAKHALQLAQLEGGLLTLQQYAPDIIKSANERHTKEPEPDPEPAVITEEELLVRSDTFRRSQVGQSSVEEIDES
tara:strand:- start:380 stop:721 length:342 start_codon:yes stop_codon:yes gene_type:complete